MTKKILNIVLAVILLFIVTITALLWSEQDTPASTKDQPITVVIDPGHGGNDPGKVGTSDILEKDINLEIALTLADILKESGINVIMTRDEDYGLYEESDSNKKNTDLHNRCKLVEESDAALVVSIHQNSFTDSTVSGAQVFYYSSSEKSKSLAQEISNSLSTSIGKDNTRPIKANSDYFLLLNTPCPCIIIECGFLSNPTETKKLQDPDYQLLLSRAISQGVLDFLNNND